MTDIYKRENKDSQVRWSDLEMSVANLQNSMILHRSTMAKKEEKLKAMEMQQNLILEQRNRARVQRQTSHKQYSDAVQEADQDEEDGRAYSASDSFEEI